MKERIKKITKLYRQHEAGDGKPFDAIWEWCTSGDSRRERYRRFKAAQRWAQVRRDNSAGPP